MKAILVNVLTLLFFLSCLIGLVSTAKADIIRDNGIPVCHQPYIVTPINSIYHVNSLILNVSFHAGVWANVHFTMVYSLDGQENKSLSLVAHDYNFFENDLDYFDGSAILSDMTDGLHNLTVYLGCDWEILNQTTSWHEYYSDRETVYFTIDNSALTTPPPTSTLLPTVTFSPSPSPSSTSTQHPTNNGPIDNSGTLSLTTLALVAGVILVIIVVSLFLYVRYLRVNTVKNNFGV